MTGGHGPIKGTTMSAKELHKYAEKKARVIVYADKRIKELESVNRELLEAMEKIYWAECQEKSSRIALGFLTKAKTKQRGIKQ